MNKKILIAIMFILLGLIPFNNNIVSAQTNSYAFNLHSPRFTYAKGSFGTTNEITFTIESTTTLPWTVYISLINEDGSMHTRYATFPESGTTETTLSYAIPDWWLQDTDDGRAYRIMIESGGLTDNRTLIDSVTGFIMPAPSNDWYSEIGAVTFGDTYQNDLIGVNYMQSGLTYYEPFRDTNITQSRPSQFTVSNRDGVAYLHYALDITEYSVNTIINDPNGVLFNIEIFDELNNKKIMDLPLSNIMRYQRYNLDYQDTTIVGTYQNDEQWSYGFVPLEITFAKPAYLREGDNYLFKNTTFVWPFDAFNLITGIPNVFPESMYSASIQWGYLDPEPSESILLITQSGQLPIDAYMQYNHIVPGNRQSLIIKSTESRFANQFYVYNAYDPSGEIGGGDTGQQEIFYSVNLPLSTTTYEYTTQTSYFDALNTTREDVIVQLLIVPKDGINFGNPYMSGETSASKYYIHDVINYTMHSFENYENIFTTINDVDEGLPSFLSAVGWLNPAGVMMFTFFILLIVSVLLHVIKVPMIGIMIVDFLIIGGFMIYDEFYREWFIIGIGLLFVAAMITAFKGFGRGNETYGE